MSDYVFLADTETLPRHLVEDVVDMVAEAEEIDLDEFRDEVGDGAYEGIAHALGYPNAVELEDDELVSAHRGTLRGIATVFLERGTSEYIYVPQNELRGLTRVPRKGL